MVPFFSCDLFLHVYHLLIIMTFLEVVGDLLIFLHTPRHVRVNVPVIFSLPLAAVTGTMTLIKATPLELKVMVEPPCLHHFDFVNLTFCRWRSGDSAVSFQLIVTMNVVRQDFAYYQL